MKKKKTLIIGIILVLIGLLIISTAINIKIGRVNNNNKETKEIKKEEKLYKLNDDGTIYFKDKNLEKAIKEETKLDTLTPESVKNITELKIEEKKITNITGIEYLKYLEQLSLENNYIEKIDNLKELKRLKNLTLSKNYIKSIEPLKHLSNLEALSIDNNNIKDISPLGKLQRLKSLPNIYNNPITNYDLLEDNIDMYYKNAYNDKDKKKKKTIDPDTGKSIIKTDFSNDIYGECEEDYVTCYLKDVYKQDKEQMQTYKEGIIIARDFIKNNIKEDMTDLEKEAIISRYIMEKITYNIEARGLPVEIHDYYTVFVKGEGVCHHYAQAFNILAALAGLESISAESDCSDEECNNDDSHEWNIVKIDNRYYHLDLTWEDDNFGGYYINLSTEDMNNNHFGIGKFIETKQTKKLDLTKSMDYKKKVKVFYPDQAVE